MIVEISLLYATSSLILCWLLFLDCLKMSSTEDENVVLSQSRAVGLKESEAEVESVVESVVQGERTVVASDEVEGGEAGDAANDEPVGLGFGEKGSSSEDGESCAETESYHSATSDGRHDLNYLADKKGKLSRN